MRLTCEIHFEWNKYYEEPEFLRLLQQRISKKYSLKMDDIQNLSILRSSIDGRKKPCIIRNVKVSFSLDEKVAKQLLKRFSKDFSIEKKVVYEFPKVSNVSKKQPIIVGSGPAGLFCAFALVQMGYQPTILEQGATVDERTVDVENYWKSGELNPYSNVQFGEGGAGTFSDGKLATGVKDPYGRIPFILETFVRFGADPSILYDAKPHIGTDVLKCVVKNMRTYLEEKGARFLFRTRFEKILKAEDQLTGILARNVINNEEFRLETEDLILATGHSARETFVSLHQDGVSMSNKPFAVGFRIEHPQSLINHIQYGDGSEEKGLPSADYKITYHTESGRSFYSFCMCPGGYVVNASSEPEMVCCNGMSYHGRNGKNANSAIVLNVTEDDFGTELFAGMAFQRELEKNTYIAGQGKLPYQKLKDFAKEVHGKDYENFTEKEYYESFQYENCGESVETSLVNILPDSMNFDLLEGILATEKRFPGYANGNAILLGVETRTSSPVKIFRDETFQSNVKGIYPCGEGAGYAGGITSAALDGLKVAEMVVKHYN